MTKIDKSNTKNEQRYKKSRRKEENLVLNEGTCNGELGSLSGDRRTGLLLKKLMEKKNEFPKPLIDSAHLKYQCCCA